MADVQGSERPNLQWERSYPKALKDRELELLRGNPCSSSEGEMTQREMKVGVALSGGGLRSATFAFGVLQALAKKNLLKERDLYS